MSFRLRQLPLREHTSAPFFTVAVQLGCRFHTLANDSATTTSTTPKDTIAPAVPASFQDTGICALVAIRLGAASVVARACSFVSARVFDAGVYVVGRISRFIVVAVPEDALGPLASAISQAVEHDG